MNVYHLRINSDKSADLVGGSALVAAPSYEMAKYEYELNGDYGEQVAMGDFVFHESCKYPILGLSYDGGIQIVADDFCLID